MIATDLYTDQRILRISIDGKYRLTQLGALISLVDRYYLYSLHGLLLRPNDHSPLVPTNRLFELINEDALKMTELMGDLVQVDLIISHLIEKETFIIDKDNDKGRQRNQEIDFLITVNDMNKNYNNHSDLYYELWNREYFRFILPSLWKLELLSIERVNPININLQGIADPLIALRDFIIYLIELRSNKTKKRLEIEAEKLKILKMKLELSKEYNIPLEMLNDMTNAKTQLFEHIVENDKDEVTFKVEIYDADGNVI